MPSYVRGRAARIRAKGTSSLRKEWAELLPGHRGRCVWRTGDPETVEIELASRSPKRVSDTIACRCRDDAATLPTRRGDVTDGAICPLRLLRQTAKP